MEPKKVMIKLLWVGRATVLIVGLAVILALVLGVAKAAFGANGGTFILGQTNAATAITRLAGTQGVNGAMFVVKNNNADTNDTTLCLKVQAGEPPMKVNSSTMVANLNVDKLDDLDRPPAGQRSSGRGSKRQLPQPADRRRNGRCDRAGATPSRVRDAKHSVYLVRHCHSAPAPE